jgi:hypothetical protein
MVCGSSSATVSSNHHATIRCRAEIRDAPYERGGMGIKAGSIDVLARPDTRTDNG